MKAALKWLKETYVDIPTQPGWIGLVLIVILTITYLDKLA